MKITGLACLLFFSLFPALSFAQQNNVAGVEQGTQFNFVLKDNATTSAGVYTSDGVLLRTLWSGKKFGPGKHSGFWDGMDDEGGIAGEGAYNIRILSNNVKYTWDGVIGNTSDSFTGGTVFRGYNTINGMAIAGNTAYYCKSFSEGSASYAKFQLNKPGQKQWLNDKWHIPSLITYAVATDGVNVYWANTDPPDPARSFVFATKTSDDADVIFAKGTGFTTKFGVAFKSTIDLLNNKNGRPTGIAVQKKGRFLLIAHAALNEIHVLDKATGELVQTIPLVNPVYMAMDALDNVWICYTENNIAVVRKFEITGNGTLSTPALSLAGLAAPLAVAVSPDNKYVVVADGGASQQLKAFNNQTGLSEWVYGRAGGYINDPLVTFDKFYFSDKRTALYTIVQPFIAFQPDGSFWAGDPGNARTLHFSADRKYLNEIMYLPDSYSCVADANNPERVFSDYLEFKVDYSKPLKPANGSWQLVKNWGATVPDILDNHYYRFTSLTTLGNGKTYALFAQANTTLWQLAELPAQGPLRFTGIKIPGILSTRLHKDGSLRMTPRVVIGKPMVWTIRRLTGFDKADNPVWGNEEILATSPPATKEDPGYWGKNIMHSGEITSSGILVSFDNGTPPHGSDEYHLGGIKLGDNKWLWKTAKVTSSKYTGEYPADGDYDIGNSVVYAGNIHVADGKSIFWGYNGEFWKSSQVNKWNHVWDDGLFIGQFGTTGVENTGEAPAGMAGNAFSGSVVHLNDSTSYLYHNDESYHSGIHRWKISGINSVTEQVVPVKINASTAHGLLAKVYDDTLFDDVDLRNTGVVPLNDLPRELETFVAKNSLSKKYSVTLSGFVKPSADGLYSFYTGVNEGSRLWVNGQLLADDFFKTNQGNGAVTVYLMAGRQYPVLLEFCQKGGKGMPVLSWSSASISKQPVPSGLLLPAQANLTRSNAVDLMEGLRNNSYLENGLYGWSRYPVFDDSTNRHSKWWIARTNIKKIDRQGSPDIYIFSTQASGTAQVTRNLGDFNAPLNVWSLFGNINYEKNFPNLGTDPGAQGSGGCNFEVLDNKGKILLRFFPVIVHYWNDIRLYVNDKILLQGNIDDFRKFTGHANKIDITFSNGKLNVHFGNLAPVSVSSFDPAGQPGHPKTMRIFFWCNGNNFDRVIDLEDFYFKQGFAD